MVSDPPLDTDPPKQDPIKKSQKIHDRIHSLRKEIRAIPGLDVLGYGYHVIGGEYASPKSCTFPLFDSKQLGELHEVKIESSRIYLVPENVLVRDFREGMIDIQSGDSIEELQIKINAGLSIGSKYKFFSASIKNDFIFEDAISQEYVFTRISDVISKWILQLPDIDILKTYLIPKIKNELNDAIIADDYSTTKNNIYNIFDKYGTHFLWNLIVGARATSAFATNKTEEATKTSISTIAQASYFKMVGMNSHLDIDEDIDNFNKASTNRVKTIGGNPAYAKKIADGYYDLWTDSVNDNPVFSDFTKNSLIPIWYLLDSDKQSTYADMFELYAEKLDFLPKQGIICGQPFNLKLMVGGYAGRGDFDTEHIHVQIRSTFQASNSWQFTNGGENQIKYGEPINVINNSASYLIKYDGRVVQADRGKNPRPPDSSFLIQLLAQANLPKASLRLYRYDNPKDKDGEVNTLQPVKISVDFSNNTGRKDFDDDDYTLQMENNFMTYSKDKDNQDHGRPKQSDAWYVETIADIIENNNEE